jgi:hypothetical protein
MPNANTLKMIGRPCPRRCQYFVGISPSNLKANADKFASTMRVNWMKTTTSERDRCNH